MGDSRQPHGKATKGELIRSRHADRFRAVQRIHYKSFLHPPPTLFLSLSLSLLLTLSLFLSICLSLVHQTHPFHPVSQMIEGKEKWELRKNAIAPSTKSLFYYCHKHVIFIFLFLFLSPTPHLVETFFTEWWPGLLEGKDVIRLRFQIDSHSQTVPIKVPSPKYCNILIIEGENRNHSSGSSCHWPDPVFSVNCGSKLWNEWMTKSHKKLNLIGVCWLLICTNRV